MICDATVWEVRIVNVGGAASMLAYASATTVVRKADARYEHITAITHKKRITCWANIQMNKMMMGKNNNPAISGTIKSLIPQYSNKTLEKDFKTPDETIALMLKPIAKNSVKRLPSK